MQSILRKNTKIEWKINIPYTKMYLSNMWNYRIWAPFHNKIATFLIALNNQLRWTFCNKNHIKIGWNFERKKNWPFSWENGNSCLIMLYIFLKDIFLRSSLKKYWKQMNNKCFTCQKKNRKHHGNLDFHFETGRATFLIQFQPWFWTKDHSVNNSEESVN